MSYEEWLNNIEILKKSNDHKVKDKLLNEPANANIQTLLEPKIIDLIKYKLQKATEKIIYNLSDIFQDENILDSQLVYLKKNLKFITELTYIKEIPEDSQKELRIALKKEYEDIYNILIDGANRIDDIGLLALTIKSNMYKME